MSTDLRNVLRTIRQLYETLPTLSAEQVDELIDLELQGAKRRSVLTRLTSRAIQLAGDVKNEEIQSRILRIKEKKNGTSTRKQK